MIKNKRELRAYLQVDRMMNRNAFSWGWKERLKNRIVRDYVMDFLVHLRKYEYYMNQRGPIARLLELHHHRVYRELGVKLGFSIPPNVFGCGLVLPHYGTVVIGGENTLASPSAPRWSAARRCSGTRGCSRKTEASIFRRDFP